MNPPACTLDSCVLLRRFEAPVSHCLHVQPARLTSPPPPPPARSSPGTARLRFRFECSGLVSVLTALVLSALRAPDPAPSPPSTPAIAPHDPPPTPGLSSPPPPSCFLHRSGASARSHAAGPVVDRLIRPLSGRRLDCTSTRALHPLAALLIEPPPRPAFTFTIPGLDIILRNHRFSTRGHPLLRSSPLLRSPAALNPRLLHSSTGCSEARWRVRAHTLNRPTRRWSIRCVNDPTCRRRPTKNLADYVKCKGCGEILEEGKAFELGMHSGRDHHHCFSSASDMPQLATDGTSTASAATRAARSSIPTPTCSSSATAR